MVLHFVSTALGEDRPVLIYMGIDKVENEDLIKYAYPNDVWTHVDKLSSAHVYLRLPEGIEWESIPEPLLVDAAQLVKANSIIGNKKDNLTIIYTPASNLRKSGDMAVGQVSFHSDKKVKRIHIATRLNPIINRLNRTKATVVIDHEVAKIEREKVEAKARREVANTRANLELGVSRERKELAKQRGYGALHGDGAGGREMTEEEETEEWERRQKVGDFEPDEDFM